MAASSGLKVAAAISAATFATAPSNVVYADSFRFNPFSTSRSSSSQPDSSRQVNSESGHSGEPPLGRPDDDEDGEVEVAQGAFDEDYLIRGGKAVSALKNHKYSKQLQDVMKDQERTRLIQNEADKLQYQAHQAQEDIKRQSQMADEQLSSMQKKAQVEAQVLRQKDELERNRKKAEHEAQRKNNFDLVNMQKQSALQKERARILEAEKILQKRLQEEEAKSKVERDLIEKKAKVEAEMDIRVLRSTEEENRRLLLEELNGEREKWLAAVNATFSHIEGGLKSLFNDRSKLIMTVGGATALAAGIYTTREGARVTWSYINRILGQPSLIRESSIAKYPWSGLVSKGVKALPFTGAASTNSLAEGQSKLGNVILHPSLQRRIEQLARATANTKAHQAPFRNMLFYGPPGTGKTMVAREIARRSGLDYAMMTGGDVAPLGPQAVTKIHEIFDWSKKSRKGLLLFIDEADAFLCERNSIYMSEAQRSALNALLFRTGDQSWDVVLVLATNRPGDLDRAITDRIDEVIEFPLPGEEERFKLLKLYLDKYLKAEPETKPGLGLLLSKRTQTITVKDLTDDVIREAAKKTEGFSGREIAKLVASVQAAVYGRADCILDPEMFREVVDYKVKEHHQRIKLAEDGCQPAFC